MTASPHVSHLLPRHDVEFAPGAAMKRIRRLDVVPEAESPVSGPLLTPAIVGKAIKPSKAELSVNPRARSAVMRIAEKLA